MGVHGLIGFLQKKVPHVFKEIPNRIQGLHGKTIVVDGTLITQRLHFSSAPHPYRHVLGWYRVVQQLQAQNVRVICVFDGNKRALAKARETARRRAHRDLEQARGQLEDSRVTRLDRLSELLRQTRRLADEDALPAPRRFYRRLLAPKWRRPQSPAVHIKRDWMEPEWAAREALIEDAEATRGLEFLDPKHKHHQNMAQRAPNVDLNWTLRDVGLQQTEIDSLVSGIDMKQHLQEATSHLSAESDQCDPRRELAALREEFERSIPKFQLPVQVIKKQVKANEAEDEVFTSNLQEATSHISAESDQCGPQKEPEREEFERSIPKARLPVQVIEKQVEANEAGDEVFTSNVQEATSPLSAESDQCGPQRAPAALREELERSIPKSRLPVQVIEKQVKANEAGDEVFTSNKVVLGGEPSDLNEHAMSRYQYDLMVQEGALWQALDSPDALDTAHALHIRSAAISASYDKRNDVPSERTYRESKQMLGALGVPCLSSNGAFEGEAFASALVHAGLADYVATEDTDVIVYEAPMLRGLTNIHSPLTVVSGTEVRESFGFTRAQFVDLMLLMGTDFSTRIRNVGPMRALKLVEEYGSIEAVLDAGAAKAYKTDLSPEGRTAYLAEAQLGRDVFNNLPSVVQDEIDKAFEVQKDEAKVKELLHAFDLERAAYEPELRQWMREGGGEESVGLGADYWAVSQNVEGLNDDGHSPMGFHMFDDAPMPAQRLQEHQ